MSPIKGLTESIRLPRLGKIRIGIKETSQKTGNPYPKKVDYFVCPDNVQSIFGDKPRELRIMFPTEEPDQWASQYYRCYSKTRGLVCKGDGETAWCIVDVKTGEIASPKAEHIEWREITCDTDTCTRYKSNACKPVMNLQFLMPEVPGLGIWQLDTSSINTIVNINSGIRLIQGVCGRISMIPLTLKVVPKEVTPEGKRTTVYVLEVSTNETLMNILGRLQTLPPGKALLPESDMEAPDDLFPDEVLTEAEIKQNANQKVLDVSTTDDTDMQADDDGVIISNEEGTQPGLGDWE